MNGISGFRPPVQFGVRIRLAEEEVQDAGIGTVISTVAPTVTAYTGSASAGAYLESAGIGLILSGPESGAAAQVLASMQTLGSEGLAASSADIPSLGGSGMCTAGTALLTASGAFSDSTQSQAPN